PSSSIHHHNHASERNKKLLCGYIGDDTNSEPGLCNKQAYCFQSRFFSSRAKEEAMKYVLINFEILSYTFLIVVTIGPAEIISPQAAERPVLKPSDNKEIEEMERRRRIGSKPPSCEKKCYGCEPCEAVQVPTISSVPHLSPHYANYQPEGWRCHCAP
ncbi:unnamed protein product, partial [Thlaspi arvense]